MKPPVTSASVGNKYWGAATYLLMLISAVPAVKAPAEILHKSGWRALPPLDWLVLFLVFAAVTLSLAGLLRHRIHALHTIAGPWLFPVLLILVGALLCYTLWRTPPVAWVFATAGVSYAFFRLWAIRGWLVNPSPPSRVLIDDSFRTDVELGAGWDEVQYGEPNQMIVSTDGALRVAWYAGLEYSVSGYLVKNLPPAPVRVEMEIEARRYMQRIGSPDIFWFGVGIFFYVKRSMYYCLGVSLEAVAQRCPSVAEPGGVTSEIPSSSLELHSGDLRGPGGLFVKGYDPDAHSNSHWALDLSDWDRQYHPVDPGARRSVRVELRGKNARISVDERVTDVELVCRPEELVVGAAKWRQPGWVARESSEHVIRHVRVLLID